MKKFEINLEFKSESFAKQVTKDLEKRGEKIVASEKDGKIILSFQPQKILALASSYEEKMESEYKDKDENKSSEDIKKEILREVNSSMYSMLEAVYENLQWEFKYLYRELDYLYEWVDKHQEGHLPNMKTKSDMDKALDVLGQSDNYEVAKPTIRVHY